MGTHAANLNKQLAAAGLPEGIGEWRFVVGRRFRFDIAWPEYKFAIEVEGGVFGIGKPCFVCGRKKQLGHNSVAGMLRDFEKYNLATLSGWRVLRVLPKQIGNGDALALVEQALAKWRNENVPAR